jgi:hypothetical protein
MFISPIAIGPAMARSAAEASNARLPKLISRANLFAMMPSILFFSSPPVTPAAQATGDAR